MYARLLPPGTTVGYVTVVDELLLRPVPATSTDHVVPAPPALVNCCAINRCATAAIEPDGVTVIVAAPAVVTTPSQMLNVLVVPTKLPAILVHVVTPPPATDEIDSDVEVRLDARMRTSPTAVGDTGSVVVPVPPEV